MVLLHLDPIEVFIMRSHLEEKVRPERYGSKEDANRKARQIEIADWVQTPEYSRPNI